MNYNIVDGIAIALLLGILLLIRSARRIPRYNFGGVVEQPPIHLAGPQAQAGHQPPAGRGPVSPFVGFAFFFAVAIAFPAAYFLPYPWNGMAFIAIATAAFFVKMRWGKEDITSWDGVWNWLTASKRVYRRGENGKPDRSKITGTSYRRISGFVVAEAFALGMFEAFFGHIVPNYPIVVLAFFMVILWFIATKAAENFIDKVARYFSYTLLVAVAGSAVVITLYFLYFGHIEQRMASVAFVALVLGILGICLCYRESQEVKNAGLALLIVSFVGLMSVATDIVSVYYDIPMKQTADQTREYQRGERKDIDVRFFPRAKTEPVNLQSPTPPKAENTPVSQAQLAPAPPAQPAQTQTQQPVQVEVVVKHESRPVPAENTGEKIDLEDLKVFQEMMREQHQVSREFLNDIRER